MRPIRHILVAVEDPTAKSLPAVVKGAQLARAFGAHLELFHAISAPLYVDAYSPDASVSYIERRTRHESVERLEKIASKLRAGGLEIGVSALDREILDIAMSLSEALRGPLHAVNAYAPLPVQQPPPHQLLTEQAVNRLVADTRRAAKRRFLRLVKVARIPAARCHRVGRHPIDAIEQTARKTHSSIVVLGAISRSGLKRFFFGNTAEALLDSLDCDMLIVKPPGFVSRVQRRIRGIRFAAPPYAPVL